MSLDIVTCFSFSLQGDIADDNTYLSKVRPNRAVIMYWMQFSW